MVATNVPFPTFTDTGFRSPTEQAILLGVQADWNAAFNTTLNFGTATNPTPQGQVVATMAAVIGNAYDLFCLLANSNDPAFARGRYQDAIARIYFLSRNPGAPTVAQCLCIGKPTTVIPFGSIIQNDQGVQYIAATTATIPAGGSVTIPFACAVNGPTACPADTLTTIVRAIPGWDSVGNPSAGVLGINVETRAEFETRREQTVERNSIGQNDSILGAVLDIADVLDAYVTDNPNDYPVAVDSEATVIAAISGTALTVSSVLSGAVAIGQSVTGTSGTGVSVEAGTVIVSGSGTSWVVNNSQTVVSTTMQLGGVTLGANALYVAEVGGDEDAVAEAIWSKKPPGTPFYAGNTSVVVYDTNPIYVPPGIPYTIIWEVPPALPFVFKVSLVDNPGIPSNATALIQQAIIDAFSGSIDGIPRARIGSTVISTRYVAPIVALGSWAQIASILMGTENLPAARATASIGAAFTGTASGTTMTASSVSGYISVGDLIAGPGVLLNSTVVSQDSGSPGGAGDYTLTNAATSSGAALHAFSTVLNVTAVASGVLALGQYLFDASSNVDDGTTITADLGGGGGVGQYTVSIQQRLASEAVLFVVPDQTVIAVRINQAPTTNAELIEVDIITL